MINILNIQKYKLTLNFPNIISHIFKYIKGNKEIIKNKQSKQNKYEIK